VPHSSNLLSLLSLSPGVRSFKLTPPSRVLLKSLAVAIRPRTRSSYVPKISGLQTFQFLSWTSHFPEQGVSILHTINSHIPPPEPTIHIQEQELWVIDKFVNSRWFRGKFQLKVRWEDQLEEQDNWQDYFKILEELIAWQEELRVGEEAPEDQVCPMIEEYYARHPGAPWHDDPPHCHQAPPCHQAVRRR